jgi:pimeloyl-ACP methyl ester carboxylesterase
MPPEGNLVAVNGMQMYYEVHGEGAPLVLLHGFTGSSRFWQPFIVPFAKQYRLVVPDMRGHGRSTNPANKFTHRQSALDIYALLDQLEIDTFRAIGVSSGGMTLLHMATQQPARVKAMVLVGATIYFPEACRAIQRQCTPESWDWGARREWHVYGDRQRRALIEQFRGFADSYDDMYFTPPYLSTITARTLIVHGDRDMFFPVSIPVEMYTAIPRAYLWIIPNGEHNPIVDGQAAAFTEGALAFLAGEWETA